MRWDQGLVGAKFFSQTLRNNVHANGRIIMSLYSVIPDFKDKTRYAPYASFKRQISHIATNKG